MIPKIIHYCWFGKKEKNKLVKKCIDSWRRFCPDFEIIEWTEDNYDVNKNAYMSEAYHKKKWAFVSDYARFDILYNYGGIYFDTDVELIKPIDDIIKKGAFMAFESNLDIRIAPGLGIAAQKHDLLLKKVLDMYSGIHFLNEDSSINQKTVVSYLTEMILEDFDIQSNSEIVQYKNFNIFPKDYFCPLDYRTGKLTITENTRSIHHYAASWTSKKEKFFINMLHVVGEKNYSVLLKLKNQMLGIFEKFKCQ